MSGHCPKCGIDLTGAAFTTALGEQSLSWCTPCARYVYPELPLLVDVTDDFGCYASLRSASEVKRNGWPRVRY